MPVRIPIRGTASGVPGDRQLWALVQADGIEGYYPQPGPLEIDAEGTWQVTARVGTNSASEWNRPFTITVVAVIVAFVTAVVYFFIRRRDTSSPVVISD